MAAQAKGLTDGLVHSNQDWLCLQKGCEEHFVYLPPHHEVEAQETRKGPVPPRLRPSWCHLLLGSESLNTFNFTGLGGLANSGNCATESLFDSESLFNSRYGTIPSSVHEQSRDCLPFLPFPCCPKASLCLLPVPYLPPVCALGGQGCS